MLNITAIETRKKLQKSFWQSTEVNDSDFNMACFNFSYGHDL